jgi:poly(hydroxyalkanoate) granule-associated protein
MSSERIMSKPKLKNRATAEAAAQQARGVSKTVMDSAQQIWLAGLGAFVKAQAEGGKLFESLVKEGAALDAKTRKFTDAKVAEARGNVESTLGQVRERSQETWDKLEKVFEDRVSRALGRLGVPGRDEIRTLTSRVEELSREVRKSNAGGGAAKKRARKTAKR